MLGKQREESGYDTQDGAIERFLDEIESDGVGGGSQVNIFRVAVADDDRALEKPSASGAYAPGRSPRRGGP
ncbi:hypothetical protein ACFV0D_15185, partial [Streptomyces sp. NPDC059556]|uniref:hypothetical protein n=1 Tax=Streptomyces sp. NPDC059556 TaxID=3346863 RepID=UPI0036972750